VLALVVVVDVDVDVVDVDDDERRDATRANVCINAFDIDDDVVVGAVVVDVVVVVVVVVVDIDAEDAVELNGDDDIDVARDSALPPATLFRLFVNKHKKINNKRVTTGVVGTFRVALRHRRRRAFRRQLLRRRRRRRCGCG
jgi:hypothetical protein